MKEIEYSLVRKKYIERQSESDNNLGMKPTIAGFDKDCTKEKIKWYETELDHNSNFVNNIFTNLFDMNNMLGKSCNRQIRKLCNVSVLGESLFFNKKSKSSLSFVVISFLLPNL